MHELVNKRYTLFTCATEPRKQRVKRLTCVKRKEINNRIWLFKKSRTGHSCKQRKERQDIDTDAGGLKKKRRRTRTFLIKKLF